MMNGEIFNIQRFCTHDGPGIRTVVFMKGCPLDCAWCHNPESKSFRRQIMFDEEKCINCGWCKKICKSGAHMLENNKHTFIRGNCRLCMNCTQICPTGALEKCGEIKTVEEILEVCMRDAEFYKQSGGGITLSGGEPLYQFDFLLEILKKAKEMNINTAIETSGFSSKELDEINQYTDLWLYDIKLLDEEEHKKYTGVSNKIILENLRQLDSIGAAIILRCPIIPGVNFTENYFKALMKLGNSLKNVKKLQLEPYHPLGIYKAERCGIVQKYDNKNFLSGKEVEKLLDKVKTVSATDVEII